MMMTMAPAVDEIAATIGNPKRELADYFTTERPQQRIESSQPRVRMQTNGITTNATQYPPSAYTRGNYRWAIFEAGGSVTFYASGAQPGYDYIGSVQRGVAAWTNDPTSTINYRYGGTTSSGHPASIGPSNESRRIGRSSTARCASVTASFSRPRPASINPNKHMLFSSLAQTRASSSILTRADSKAFVAAELSPRPRAISP